MADRLSVLRGLKSSPKGQLCYEEEWKKENFLHSLRHGSLQQVVEEHCPRWSEEEADGVATDRERSALRRVSTEGKLVMREYLSDEQGLDRNSETELIRTHITEVAERGTRGSKEGEEVTHRCGVTCVCACVNMCSCICIPSILPPCNAAPPPPCAVIPRAGCSLRPTTILRR